MFTIGPILAACVLVHFQRASLRLGEIRAPDHPTHTLLLVAATVFALHERRLSSEWFRECDEVKS